MHTPSFVCITLVGLLANTAWGIVMPSIWEFIHSKNGHHYHLGIAVSVFSLYQIFFLQIFGKWADNKPMKISLLFSLTIGTLSYILYAFGNSPSMIILARLLAGIEAGNLTLTNSFIVVSTNPSERTKYIAKMNGINVIGFVIAPLINFLLLETNFYVGKAHVGPDVAAGLLVVILHVLLILVFLFKFQEPSKAVSEHASLLHSYKERDDKSDSITLASFESQPKTSKKITDSAEVSLLHGDGSKDSMPDDSEGGVALTSSRSMGLYPSTEISKVQFVLHSFGKVYGVCFLAMFVQNFLFSFLVTAITPITQQHYDFTPFENSLMFSFTSVIMVLVIFIVSVCSHVVKNIDRVVILVSQLFMGASLISLGYSLDERISFVELCLVVVLLVIGVPGQNTAITSIYSKFITSE